MGAAGVLKSQSSRPPYPRCPLSKDLCWSSGFPSQALRWKSLCPESTYVCCLDAGLSSDCMHKRKHVRCSPPSVMLLYLSFCKMRAYCSHHIARSNILLQLGLHISASITVNQWSHDSPCAACLHTPTSVIKRTCIMHKANLITLTHWEFPPTFFTDWRRLSPSSPSHRFVLVGSLS